MRRFTVLSLLVVCCVSLSVAQVSFDDCCLKYVRRPSRQIQKHVVDYSRQETDGDCNLPAIIFTMKRGRMFCTDPTHRWVQMLMMQVDRRKFKSKFGKKPLKG